jgi:hypothetical protein
MTSRLRIIVTGMVGLYPVGGVAWDYLQYLLGLARLGHDVYYYEDTWSWPYQPVEKTYTADGSYSADYIGQFLRRYAPALSDRWLYLHLHDQAYGMSASAFDEVARSADLFLNISGACLIPDRLSADCIKVFVDTDPGYNQIVLSERPDWSENVARWSAGVEAHDEHFTYAENIHGADCLVPRLGFRWKTTRMPIVRSLWSGLAAQPAAATAPWTTVMTWNAFKGRLSYRGVEYKSKSGAFEGLIDLPRHVDLPLTLAVGGANAPLQRLAQCGWRVVDGPASSLTPAQYQAFIQASRGEFSPAKHVYVAMRTGWFSCRSACYLAAGRPVVVQDTGFQPVIPVGEGILAFSTMHEAVHALNSVEADYQRHVRAAREIAEQYFDSDRVLKDLIDAASGKADEPRQQARH